MMQDISKATDDDVIHIGDYVNIYPVFLSTRAIIILQNRLNWLENTIVLDHIFSSISCKLIWELSHSH